MPAYGYMSNYGGDANDISPEDTQALLRKLAQAKAARAGTSYPQTSRAALTDSRRGMTNQIYQDERLKPISDALARLFGGQDETVASAPVQGMGESQSNDVGYPGAPQPGMIGPSPFPPATTQPFFTPEQSRGAAENMEAPQPEITQKTFLGIPVNTWSNAFGNMAVYSSKPGADTLGSFAMGLQSAEDEAKRDAILREKAQIAAQDRQERSAERRAKTDYYSGRLDLDRQKEARAAKGKAPATGKILATRGTALKSKESILSEARDAIKNGAPRDAVINRLHEAGIDASGL